MQTSIERSETNFSTLRGLGAERWLQILFAGWFLLSVTTPEEVYRTFFHALIYPLTAFLLIRRDSSALWKDSFVRLFLAFCGYMAVTTWFLGDGPVEDDFQASRWGMEAALGMTAFVLWTRSAVSRERLWGKWFLSLAFVGALGGLLSSVPGIVAGARIEGLGAMGHPIQGASIAIVFLAVGLFLTFGSQRCSSRADLLLAFFSVIVVCTFVTLTQSRGPLISLILYLLFFVILLCFQHRRPATISLFLLVAASVTGMVHWLMGLDVFLDHLLARGASYRLDIWTAYLTYLPESFLFGNGAGLDFELTEASRLYLEPMGLDISHPHNIWLGAFVETGLVGVLMQAGLVSLPVLAVLRSCFPVTSKLHLLAILGLFLLLTFSDEYTLLTSLHPIWLFGWLPLVFVWTWSIYHQPRKSAEEVTENNGKISEL